MQRVIAGLAGEAGIEMSAHTLRHTFATNYLERSKDLVGLSWLLGHRNINSTAVYVQPTMADLAERVEDAGMTG
jgi:site-specific recombinase XerD